MVEDETGKWDRSDWPSVGLMVETEMLTKRIFGDGGSFPQDFMGICH